MKTLAEIACEAGRQALAEQESEVNGVRQRTGTLLAAHALVASFFGVGVIRTNGVHGWSWVALVSLVAALGIAAVLLAPWRLTFSADARGLYMGLYEAARRQGEDDETSWLAAVAFVYQRLRAGNERRVRVMSALSGLLAALMVVQTMAWVVELLG